MKNQQLFEKYKDGSHWENRSTIYACEFAEFLYDHFEFRDAFNPQIVDLGCGNGRDVMCFIKDYLISSIGLDIKEDTEEYAYLFVQDIENLSFEDNSVYNYFCINVMHYVDQKKVLSEIYRTLRPGGYIFIHFNLLIYDENFTIDYHQKKSDVYELIKDFTIVREKVFVRNDLKPYPHTHHILEIILQKP